MKTKERLKQNVVGITRKVNYCKTQHNAFVLSCSMQSYEIFRLLNPYLGSLVRGLFYSESPNIKLHKIILRSEIWQVRTHTNICSFRKYILQYQDSANFSEVSVFCFFVLLCFVCKKSTFFERNSTFTQSNLMRAVLKTFQFSFQFLLDKKLLYMKN